MSSPPQTEDVGAHGRAPLHQGRAPLRRGEATHPPDRLRRGLLLVLRIVVAAGLIGLLLWRVDWAQFRQVISLYGLRLYLWLIPLTALNWLVYVLRWRLLLLPLGLRPRFGELVVDSLVGFFYGLFIPTGLAGDAVRAVRLGNRHRAVTQALLSVAVDRLVGLFTVLLLFGVQFARRAPPVTGIALSWAGWAVLGGLLAAALLMVGGALWLDRRPRSGDGPHPTTGSRPVRWLARQVERLAALLRAYRHGWRSLALALAISVVYQLLVTLVYTIGGATMGIRAGFGDFVWIVALVAMAQVLPITVAGLGVREGLFVFLLGQYGAPPATALALSLTVFSVTLLFALLGGMLSLTTDHRAQTTPHATRHTQHVPPSTPQTTQK